MSTNWQHKVSSSRLADWYYQLARTSVLNSIHSVLRRRRHSWKYGVNSAFMFHAVELEINSMCNRKCSYCPNVLATRPSGYMGELLFRKIIADLASMDFDGIVSYHFYGEPFLDKRLLEFVQYTSRLLPKSKPVIYSNGDFLTLELFREYILCGVDTILVTQHDNRFPPNLQQILIEATPEEKCHIEIRLAESLHMINRSGLIPTIGVPASPLQAPCDWVLGTLVITMSGNVVVCCNDYFETEVVGNVEIDSIREVWCSERFENFRRALSKGDRTISGLCMKCDYVPDQAHLRRIVAE